MIVQKVPFSPRPWQRTTGSLPGSGSRGPDAADAELPAVVGRRRSRRRRGAGRARGVAPHRGAAGGREQEEGHRPEDRTGFCGHWPCVGNPSLVPAPGGPAILAGRRSRPSTPEGGGGRGTLRRRKIGENRPPRSAFFRHLADSDLPDSPTGKKKQLAYFIRPTKSRPIEEDRGIATVANGGSGGDLGSPRHGGVRRLTMVARRTCAESATSAD